MEEPFKKQDFLGDFKEAAKFCGFCRDYCEQENIYNRDGNVHSR